MNDSFKQNIGNKPYYITTAIDYPNGPPHLGHTLEKVAADVIARFHRLQGQDTGQNWIYHMIAGFVRPRKDTSGLHRR